MATAVIMPRQGQSVESCVIGTWHKKPGDKVAVGDLLFTYETDKATFEEESKVEGTLLALFFEEGDDVECLINVCVIGSEGESFDEFRPSGQGDGSSVSGVGQGDGSPVSGGQEIHLSVAKMRQEDCPPVSSSVSGNTPISPRARKLAERAGADIARAVPTGANGRIMERDIQKVIDAGFLGTRSALGSLSGAVPTGLGGRVTAHDLANAQAHGRPSQAARSFDASDLARLKGLGDSSFEDVKLSGVRKFISGAMHASLANSAQLTHHSSFDASDILNFRKKLKSLKNDDVLSKISVTDIIIYAVSRVIAGHKSFNAHFLGDSMRFFDNVHIGVAVDTPRGLLVPTVGYANTLGLADLSLFMKSLISSSREGSIEPDFLKGGTFTISNLGAMGVEMFTPIINPPQTGILGVCSIVERFKYGKSYPAMGLSLTYDHRALDGADAARFQKDLVDYLENFSFNLTVERGM